MPMSPDPGSLPSRLLPEYIAVVAVDQEGFTRLPGARLADASAAIGPAVDRALTAAGLDAVRDAKLFPRDTGDGLVFGCATGYVPQLVDSFLDALERDLARHNATPDGPALRLRVALALGPLLLGTGPGAGNGPARNEAHRLLDAAELKRLLARASRRTTNVVAIVSDTVYRDFVLAEHTELSPERFRSVVATVDSKGFAQRAWIYVPSPPGDLLDDPAADVPDGGVPDRAAPLALPAVDGARSGPGLHQYAGQGVVVAGGFSGDLSLSFTTPSGAPDGRGPGRR
ncbi:hypothetical protein ABT093_22655 [Kitasatospora sp. NPDC002551]|uniref:hypothetical protein n=1 Tax=Kitasatospora sp. NPDC002551 TaxID=3154539 RepID=UPI0033227135